MNHILFFYALKVLSFESVTKKKALKYNSQNTVLHHILLNNTLYNNTIVV